MLLIIGAIYIYVGVLDFLHTVSFDGLNIIFNNTNISTQFWISARLLEAIGFFVVISFFTSKRKINYGMLHVMLISYTLLIVLIINNGLIPAFYIEGFGQTTLKLISESIVILLYFLTIIALTRCQTISKKIRFSLYIVLIIKILSELAFTQYSSVVEVYITAGHLLKYLSFGGIYIIFVSEILLNPKKKIYSLFQERETELLALSELDQLTQLYNHQTTFNKVEEMIRTHQENKEEIFIAMIDIDDFKIINDTYGHQFGDDILGRFSKVLLNLDCKQKVVGRYGGDEFLICGLAKDKESRLVCFQKAQEEMMKEFSDIKTPLTFSVGLVFYKEDDTLKDLIYKADIKLYESKRNGKNQITIYK